MTVYYKALSDSQTAYHGGRGKWVKRRWRTVDGPLVPCENGLHFCRRDQLIDWLGPQIWLFEDGSPDETITDDTKMVTRRGRVVERLESWNERTSRLFAADCAERVLHLIPSEQRDPFVASVAAARAFAHGDISRWELDAAGAAAGAAAGDAARAAARAARDAARDAARAAARAARDAARDAAWAAARAAARADQTKVLFAYLHGSPTA